MALCDFLISADIAGYDCENPMVKGAKADGLIINRKDINMAGVTYDSSTFNPKIIYKRKTVFQSKQDEEIPRFLS